jgi:tetratricopeptide (TPR) repeat protein
VNLRFERNHLYKEAYDLLKKYHKAMSYYKKAIYLNPGYKIPSNLSRRRTLIISKIIWTVLITASVILLYEQYTLFKNGTLKPIIYNIDINIDKDVILVNNSAKVSESHSIFPWYGKDQKVQLKLITIGWLFWKMTAASKGSKRAR